jgi:K+-transporting ATPase c subunit
LAVEAVSQEHVEVAEARDNVLVTFVKVVGHSGHRLDYRIEAELGFIQRRRVSNVLDREVSRVLDVVVEDTKKRMVDINRLR